MGYRNPSSVGALVGANSTGTGSEFALMQVGPISTPGDNGVIIVMWSLAYIVTATTVDVRMLLRRGVGVAGALLQQYIDLTGTAGQGLRTTGFFLDTLPTSGPQIYALNVANITGGAAQAFSELSLFAFAF